MYLIYQSALFASVWLGPAADNSDTLMDQMEKLNADLATQLKYVESVENIVQYVKELGPLENVLSVTAISVFIHQPYWGRVWIQQELRACLDCYFHCGSKRTPRFTILGIGLIVNALLEWVKLEADVKDPKDPLAQIATLDEPAWDLFGYATTRFQDRTEIGKPTIKFVYALEDVYVTGYGLQATDERD